MIHNQINRDGIGRLQEKTVHAVLKHYFEPDEEKHEVRKGRYVADIALEDGVIEVQTASFHLMRGKLERFLADGRVTIVYPIPHHKWLYWMDPETGEMSGKRKSPKTGTPYIIFKELYKISQYLDHPHLNIHIVLMDVEEYRLLNGWSKDRKKGSTRYERIPVGLVDEVVITNMDDYRQLIPESLPTHFTAKEYKQEARIGLSNAQTALLILNRLGVVKRVGKKGKAYLYEALL